jgi:hypothetical protein
VTQLGQALSLSGIGIFITFGALVIIILLIRLLKLVFPAGKSDVMSSQAGYGMDAREILKEQAAAVAVAALLDKEKGVRKSRLGALLEESVGEWWKQGLDRNLRKE